MKRVYVTFLTPADDEKNTYLVEVPDLNILTEGYGLEDAISMARDAIGLAGITKQDQGANIPEPTGIKDIDVKIDQKKIELSEFDEYRRKVDNKCVRRNITLPNWLNRAADEAHINVSRIAQEAIKAKLNLV